mmetsp:Transcript_28294/g.47509  ORF Transcript_28294/g.47509 Transcript_28294/m.47509 type:complete len:293 (-) Transcript_28294:181-1059(-)
MMFWRFLLKERRGKDSRLEDGIVGRADTSDGVPTSGGVETGAAGVVVVALEDVVEGTRGGGGEGVDEGVEEAKSGLVVLKTEIVEEGKDSSRGGGGARGSVDLGVETIDDNVKVGGKGTDVGESTTSVVEGGRGREGGGSGKVLLDGSGLVAGHTKVVGEASAGEGHSDLDGLGRVELSASDGGDKGRGSGEVGLEGGALVASNTVVTTGKEDGPAAHSKLLELDVDAGGVIDREGALSVSVRDAVDEGGLGVVVETDDPLEEGLLTLVETGGGDKVGLDVLGDGGDVLDVE